MTRLLFDTSVLIGFFNKALPMYLMRELEPLLSSRFCIASVTRVEFLSGKMYPKRYRAAEDFINRADVIHVAPDIIVLSEQYITELNMERADAVIAATAILNKMELVTFDRHFEKVPGLMVRNLSGI